MSRVNDLDDFEFIEYDDEKQEPKTRKKGKKKKNMSKGRRSVAQKLVITFESIIAILFAAVIVFYATPNSTSRLLNTWVGQQFIKSSWGQQFMAGMVDKDGYQNIYDQDYNQDQIQTNDEIDLSILDNYMNIALFGLDNGSELDRPTGGSDCIMILSIHKETSAVKILSIYRDTYMKIIGADGKTDKVYPYFKVNYAYNAGGAQAAVNTLNANLDLNIKDYVAVNFNGLAEIIDLLGGIEVNLTEEEMVYVNGYLTETRKVTGMHSPDLTQWGDNIHLDGLQATAYSRIRYTPIYLEDGTSLNNDYGRAARQRNVITKMVAKAKEAGLQNVLAMCDEIFQSEEKIFKTSIPYDDVMKLVPVILNFSFGETSSFPYTLATTDDMHITLDSGSTVVAAGLAYNVTQLHKFLFPEEEYTPSDTVETISEAIRKETGLKTIRIEDYTGQN